jgi:glyoxylase-like metal-dependent hydrolase (beta-lactamase superfamily II)
MTIHIFNGFTCNARRPSKLKTGLVCTLVETDQGPVLIDTGPGLADYARSHWMLKLFQVITEVRMDPNETAIRQVERLGFRPEDVKDVVLSHMHFDHCGGLPDFPWARVHVHRREQEAFIGRHGRWTDLAYIPRHIEHRPEFALYEDSDGTWYDFEAIRLPFSPEMWLVPLFGHSSGHCGIAVKRKDGWFFNAADAGAVYNNETPAWLIKLVLGPHDGRLRRFQQAHPEVLLANSHMYPEWFAGNTSLE